MYSQLKKTEPCAEKFQCETNCLTDIFRFNKTRTYTCKTITHMYVLRFMNRYASEIYHIFSDFARPNPKYYKDIRFLGNFVKFSQPFSVRITKSSILTPNLAGIYIPGSSVTTIFSLRI